MKQVIFVVLVYRYLLAQSNACRACCSCCRSAVSVSIIGIVISSFVDVLFVLLSILWLDFDAGGRSSQHLHSGSNRIGNLFSRNI